MLRNATVGQAVWLRYRSALRAVAGLHGAAGRVEIAGRGRPRNHGVRVGSRLVVVPAGHLVTIGAEP